MNKYKYLAAGDTITCASDADLMETLNRLEHYGYMAGVIGDRDIKNKRITIIQAPEREGKKWQRLSNTPKHITT